MTIGVQCLRHSDDHEVFVSLPGGVGVLLSQTIWFADTLLAPWKMLVIDLHALIEKWTVSSFPSKKIALSYVAISAVESSVFRRALHASTAVETGEIP